MNLFKLFKIINEPTIAMMTDYYSYWSSYWLTWAQYPIDMGELRALRNDLDTQKQRINRHDEIIYSVYK